MGQSRHTWVIWQYRSVLPNPAGLGSMGCPIHCRSGQLTAAHSRSRQVRSVLVSPPRTPSSNSLQCSCPSARWDVGRRSRVPLRQCNRQPRGWRSEFHASSVRHLSQPSRSSHKLQPLPRDVLGTPPQAQRGQQRLPAAARVLARHDSGVSTVSLSRPVSNLGRPARRWCGAGTSPPTGICQGLRSSIASTENRASVPIRTTSSILTAER